MHSAWWRSTCSVSRIRWWANNNVSRQFSAVPYQSVLRQYCRRTLFISISSHPLQFIRTPSRTPFRLFSISFLSNQNFFDGSHPPLPDTPHGPRLNLAAPLNIIFHYFIQILKFESSMCPHRCDNNPPHRLIFVKCYIWFRLHAHIFSLEHNSNAIYKEHMRSIQPHKTDVPLSCAYLLRVRRITFMVIRTSRSWIRCRRNRDTIIQPQHILFSPDSAYSINVYVKGFSQ